jgi:hypothetical protein
MMLHRSVLLLDTSQNLPVTECVLCCPRNKVREVYWSSIRPFVHKHKLSREYLEYIEQILLKFSEYLSYILKL